MDKEESAPYVSGSDVYSLTGQNNSLHFFGRKILRGIQEPLGRPDGAAQGEASEVTSLFVDKR